MTKIGKAKAYLEGLKDAANEVCRNGEPAFLGIALRQKLYAATEMFGILTDKECYVEELETGELKLHFCNEEE